MADARPLLALALTVGSLLLPAPALCDEGAPPAYAPATCAGGARVGHVVALSGSAQAQAPGQPPRSLVCDGALNACEEVVTSPGASLAFLSGDVLVRVGGDARVVLAGAEAAPALFVQRGAVRSTDSRRMGAAPVRLGTRDLAASASGADAELEANAVGGPSRLCAYAGSAAVEVGTSVRTLHAGECLAAQGGGAASFAAPGEPALGLEAAGFCAFEVALDHARAAGAAAPPDPAGAADPAPGCVPPGVACEVR